ncbi:sensor histidine kinase [Mangrovibacterium lignilyticum]|uniref:sensor histidine kinase n=1 Tax=Mangrovibacterium lignilyticum TaxID=2668052 RepID=UPI0013D0287E|nr:HAMP domain-containing sensor histidine kinase [Mangrovibacterium lignilyticum]
MRSASKITLIYFTISFFWILFSDKFIATLSDDSYLITKMQTYKGWFFVVSTSVFLYILISREIKKQSKLMAELKRAKEKAEESDRLKSAFLSNVSHEIRTPLNGIVGFSQLLFENDDDDTTRQMYIDQVNRNSDMLLKIINNVLEISKIQEKMIEPSFRDVPVADFLENINQIYQSKKSNLKQKGLNFQLERQPSCEKLTIKTDPDCLNQILYNLLDNAVKYTPKGEIKLSCSMDEKFLHISVSDTGIGIPERNINGIFERFNRSPEIEMSSEGFGLGLSISKGLAQALDAKIEVTSTPGKGSCFSVLIPLNPVKK